MGIIRRHRVGTFASAALPALWKALARKEWSQADLARALKLSTAQVSRLLYGERGAGRHTASECSRLLDVKIELWDKPCPPNWKPHAYPSLRPKARRELARTGTD